MIELTLLLETDDIESLCALIPLAVKNRAKATALALTCRAKLAKKTEKERQRIFTDTLNENKPKILSVFNETALERNLGVHLCSVKAKQI